MKERRRYPRFSFSHKVIYSDALNTYELKSDSRTITENVSRGGIRIRLGKVIEKGKIVNLKIYNSSYNEPVDADAKVVWTRKSVDEVMEAGLNFVRIGWVESDRLFKPEFAETE